MAKKSSSFALWVLVIAMVGALVYFGGGFSQSINPPSSSCADSTGILTVTAVSALDGAADPSSPTITCGVGDDKIKKSVTSGTTAFAIGADLTCLVSKDDYIDKSFKAEMACGGLEKQLEMFYATSDNPSITIKDPNNADATVGDDVAGGATTNLTNVDAGGTVDFDVEFKGTNTESSGAIVYVIEFPAGSGVNITDVTMGSLEEVEVSSLHTLQNAGSKAVAFKVPAVEGAIKEEYSVIATLGTSKDLSGGIYTDWYAVQEAIDDNGFIFEGIEDSDGTAKYENTGDYDIYVNAA